MEHEGRLVILTTPTKDDGVRMQIERTVGTHGKHRDLLMKQLPHMESAIQVLRDGGADLVAMSAFDWRQHEVAGLMIAAFSLVRNPHGFWWAMINRNTSSKEPWWCAIMNSFVGK